VQPIRIHQGMFRGGNDFDIFESRMAEAIGDESGGAVDVRSMLGEGADAGNAEEFFQFVEEAIFILFDEGIGGLRHASL